MEGTMQEKICGAVRPAFKTHTGEIVTHERFMEACKCVAADMRENAHAIFEEDAYAAHITPGQKQEFLAKSLANADEVEAGKVDNFTIWQRVNQAITGQCVALLSK